HGKWMGVGGNNLLSRLRKWSHRQDENFQTEAFAYLLEHLLENEPDAGVHLLRHLSGGILDLPAAEAGCVRITTQVTTGEGRPDIRIRTPQHFVYIEAKVESGLQPGQLSSYRKELTGSGIGITGLILLTRYPITFRSDD